MKNFLKPKKAPSTENAIATLTSALDELEAVVTLEQAQIEEKELEIDLIAREVIEGKERRDRAQRISQRFVELLA